MNISTRIETASLPAKQLRAIGNILNDLNTSAFLSGSELCEEYNISLASLTRLSKSLGYSGFPEFKKDLESHYKEEFSPVAQSESFVAKVGESSVLAMVLDNERFLQEQFLKLNSENEIESLVKKINQCSRVFLVGVGQLNSVVDKFSRNLKLLGKQVLCYKELGFSKQVELGLINSNDLLICFSVNKELKEFLDLFELMKSKSCTSVLVTDKKVGKLNAYASQKFVIPAKGSGVINSLTGHVLFTNIVESYLFYLDKVHHLEKIKKIEKTWDSLPIFLD